MALRFVILGGGPAGHQAATYAARLGADVTVVERDVVGGAAHLWDCIPSKAMIATGGAMAFLRRSGGFGLVAGEGTVDLDALRRRIGGIVDRLEGATSDLLRSQGVTLNRGTGRFVGPNQVTVDTAEGPVTLDADAVLVATGSRPRIPDWAEPDGDRILTTRDAYPPRTLPEHLVVIGSGVTGVEFVHMFASLGSKVTLIVSRQQVLPAKDAEVAAALEENFLARGVALLKGAKATGIERTGSDGADALRILCGDGRVVTGSHVLLAIGSVPNVDGIGLDAAGVQLDERGFPITVGHHLQTNVSHVYVAGDVSGKLPLSSVASMQGRKIAEHVMGLHALEHRHLDYDMAASAIFTEPEIADVGLPEAEAFATGRKIRVTKVPYASSPKALIDNDTRGFVKILSDPVTGVILGGSIVGRNAAELISVIAVAVTNRLRVGDILDSLLVHPSLSELLADAAE
ncbi:MAG: NADPH:quinone reductase [Actinobacteria bacterium]|nr:NADPH:quinone reductase [Actinomycetota bacterium]